MHQARRRLAALSRRALVAPSSPEIAFKGIASKGIFEATRASEVQHVIGRAGFATTATTPALVKKKGWPRRIGTLAVGTGLVGAAAWVANGDHSSRRVTMLYTIPLRLARDVSTAVSMIAG